MPLDQPDQINRALADEPSVEDPRMSFGEHLEDLRYRVILALCGPAVTTILALFFGRELVAWLVRPLAQVLRAAGLPPQTYNFTVTGGFAIYIQVSLVAGLILASPWVVYQLWKFIEGGLYQHERRVAMILLPFSAAMAALGVGFLYYIMLPLSLMFLIFFSTGYPPPPMDAPPANPVMQRMMDAVGRAAVGRGAEPVAAPQPDAATPSAQEVEVDAAAPNASPGADSGAPAGDNAALLGQLPVLRTDPPNPREGQAWLRMPERELRVYFDGHVQRFAPTVSQSLVQPYIEVRWYINFVVMMALGLIIAFQLPVIMLVLGWTGIVDPAAVARARKYCVFGCVALGALLTPSDPVTMLVLALPLWGLFEVGLLLMRWSQPRAADSSQP